MLSDTILMQSAGGIAPRAGCATKGGGMNEQHEYESISEWTSHVSELIRVSEHFQWQVAYTLLEGKNQFALNQGEWEVAKLEIAGQTNRSAKTIENWLSIARKWPEDRRYGLSIEELSFSILAELTGLEDWKADALATQAAEQMWTRDQVRAEIAKTRQPEMAGIPASGNGSNGSAANGEPVTLAAGDGWTWTSPDEPPYNNDAAYSEPHMGSDPAQDAAHIVDAYGEDYGRKLADALFDVVGLAY